MGKLYPLESNQATLLSILEQISHSESLPKKPYCTDDLTNGIYPRLQRIAITKRYIQLNPPQMQYWMVFDIDRPNSAYAWYDSNLPIPFASVVNESNTHCHIIYRLEIPVCTSDFAHIKPLQYLDAIQRAYTAKLQADVNKLNSKMIYNYVDDNMPEWAKPTVQKMMDKGFLKGDENGCLGLTDELLRVFVINDRAGVYENRWDGKSE